MTEAASSASVPRSASGTSSVAVLGGAAEPRQIFVAQGVQFLNADYEASHGYELMVPGLLTPSLMPANERQVEIPTMPNNVPKEDQAGWLKWIKEQQRRKGTFGGLSKLPIPLTPNPDTVNHPLEYTYTNSDQNVAFTLKVITKKQDFKKALETEGAMVVYEGHARYGRGP